MALIRRMTGRGNVQLDTPTEGAGGGSGTAAATPGSGTAGAAGGAGTAQIPGSAAVAPGSPGSAGTAASSPLAAATTLIPAVVVPDPAIARLQQENQELKDKELIAQGKWKELAEQRETENRALRSTNETLVNTVVKRGAIRDRLMTSGIPMDCAITISEMVDTGEVKVGESGVADAGSVALAIEKFKTSRPEVYNRLSAPVAAVGAAAAATAAEGDGDGDTEDEGNGAANGNTAGTRRARNVRGTGGENAQTTAARAGLTPSSAAPSTPARAAGTRTDVRDLKPDQYKDYIKRTYLNPSRRGGTRSNIGSARSRASGNGA